MPVLGTHQILPAEKLRELLKRLNPQESVAANALSSEAEEGLLALADDFIHRATHSACLLAQHRTSNTLEVQDLRLLLERTHRIHVLDWEAPDAALLQGMQRGAAGGGAHKRKAPAGGKASGRPGAGGGKRAASGQTATTGRGRVGGRKTAGGTSPRAAGGQRGRARGRARGGRAAAQQGPAAPTTPAAAPARSAVPQQRPAPPPEYGNWASLPGLGPQ